MVGQGMMHISTMPEPRAREELERNQLSSFRGWCLFLSGT
ncbi:hypothetical protein S1OALGB6SA_1791 [Olavius algarvensis spirochete endosymbiont]|nr:hypothetical protein S1OALGB6SA_1791 [Olavius algarvensis spirochete endosymbiont]